MFGKLATFKEFIEGLCAMNKALLDIETELRRYALGEIDARELEDYLKDARPELSDFADNYRPPCIAEDSQAGRDADALVEQLWSEVFGVVEQLQDALQSTEDADQIGVPKWLREFHERELPHYQQIPVEHHSAKEGTQHEVTTKENLQNEVAVEQPVFPRVYSGDLEVEPGEFSLLAAKFIVRKDGISFELRGDDIYGEFRIEGSLKISTPGTTHSDSFSYRYKNYREEGRATIVIHTFKAIATKCEVVGEWREGGDAWQFRGDLKES